MCELYLLLIFLEPLGSSRHVLSFAITDTRGRNPSSADLKALLVINSLEVLLARESHMAKPYLSRGVNV